MTFRIFSHHIDYCCLLYKMGGLRNLHQLVEGVARRWMVVARDTDKVFYFRDYTLRPILFQIVSEHYHINITLSTLNIGIELSFLLQDFCLVMDDSKCLIAFSA